MAGKKRNAADFPNITRSEFAKILERTRNDVYIRCPYLAMRVAFLLAFEFLYKTRLNESVSRTFPEDRKDRMKVVFLISMMGSSLMILKLLLLENKRFYAVARVALL
ncbi:MAG: hypothetical protein PVH12_02655 [Candidatus Bathyarchaeota archaeon]